MPLPKSGLRIPRRSIRGMEGAWAKMWDPPRASPTTPDVLNVADPALLAEPYLPGPPPPGLRVNPVPAFMQSLGLGTVGVPNTVSRSLLSGLTVRTWDGAKDLDFMAFDDDDFNVSRAWPGPTIRVPRGVVFHSLSQGSGPPPHTIHWHGLEPTPMNDGVGHCSMEIGRYTYQLQPNFIGTYFYHCHRNTVQHFEFGLYGMFLVEPPDAFDQQDPGLPSYAGGYPRRTAASLAGFPQFADAFVGGDPTHGLTGPGGVGVGDPHAFTVRYDVEALWVLDDRDSTWSDLARNAKAFYPGGPNTADGPLVDPTTGLNVVPVQPGVDDQFPRGFFHDFNADYWFVTGVPVPAPRGGTGTIDPEGAGLPGGEIPAALNSGVSGMQVAVDAQVGETVLVRVLNAAYNDAEVTFPVDVVVIAFDGRALGVPPFARYNHAFLLPAGTPYRLTTARRFDALIRSDARVRDVHATVKFYDTRGSTRSPDDPLLVTARIPIDID